MSAQDKFEENLAYVVSNIGNYKIFKSNTMQTKAQEIFIKLMECYLILLNYQTPN
jgi:hypothetical protein